MNTSWINTVSQAIAQNDESYSADEVQHLLITDCVYLDINSSNRIAQAMIDSGSVRLRIEGLVVTLFSVEHPGQFVSFSTDEIGIDVWICGQR